MIAQVHFEKLQVQIERADLSAEQGLITMQHAAEQSAKTAYRVKNTSADQVNITLEQTAEQYMCTSPEQILGEEYRYSFCPLCGI